MFNLQYRYFAIACFPVIAVATILASGLLHGSTSASAQGVDLNFPNPLLDSFRSSKRLPPPTQPSPAGPLYTADWAYELRQIDALGRSKCDKAAWREAGYAFRS